MSRARFIAAARIEFLAEVIYYSEAEAGLGGRFTAAVEEAAARGLAFPLSGSPYHSDTRRILVTGFPFSLIYRPEPEGIVIFGILYIADERFSKTVPQFQRHGGANRRTTRDVGSVHAEFRRFFRTVHPTAVEKGLLRDFKDHGGLRLYAFVVSDPVTARDHSTAATL